MGFGSSAARQVAQIILLDNEFTTMVDVVMEGRLVTNNISRSASMYYLGTLLTFLLALVAVFMNTPYPFTPLQVSIMSMFVEGMPSSFVTFESNYAKPKEAIIPSIMKNIFPNALRSNCRRIRVDSIPTDAFTSSSDNDVFCNDILITSHGCEAIPTNELETNWCDFLIEQQV
ncbi:hypothetical protein MGH68_12865 [Erysipelothrix sp. D19-032]